MLEEISSVSVAWEDLPWIVMGEFNTILITDEKIGGRPEVGDAAEDLRDFILRNKLIDFDLQGMKYTWSNPRAGKDLRMSRLDRVLGSPLRLEKWPNFSLKTLPKIASYHSPLL